MRFLSLFLAVSLTGSIASAASLTVANTGTAADGFLLQVVPDGVGNFSGDGSFGDAGYVSFVGSSSYWHLSVTEGDFQTFDGASDDGVNGPGGVSMSGDAIVLTGSASGFFLVPEPATLTAAAVPAVTLFRRRRSSTASPLPAPSRC